LDCHVVLKYCEILDEFIKIRVFSADDAHKLLDVDSIDGKRAYHQLIVNSCIMNYCDRVLPRLKERTPSSQPEATEELLYHLCIEVNPHLEIHNVVLPIDGGRRAQDTPELHLLEKEAEDPTAERSRQTPPFHRVSDLAKRLKRHIVGQDESILSIVRAVKKAAIGLKDPGKPVGAFLSVGQTGVGKTEMAKALARCLYADPSHMVRVDCSEYGQPHEYAKLIGAPPGYVGHNEGGYLTEQMRALGSCVVLFDEIEKAHPKLHDLLLQIVDEAFVTDAHGNKIHFNDCILILTSNVGSKEIQERQGAIGFGSGDGEPLGRETIREEALRALKQNFRPEFLNRITEVLVFNPLGVEDCIKIVGKRLTEIGARVRRTGIRVAFTRRVKEHLARIGFSHEYGARELHRVVTGRVENPLTEMIVQGEVGMGSTVRVGVRSGTLQCTVDA